MRGEVRSIGQALALLGIENVRRWATLSVLASIDDKPAELTVTALIRARFCELAGEQLAIASRSELFTLGLFSVIDAMMDAPMHDLVASLPFTEEMREALVGRRGKRGELLDCVASLEAGECDQAPAGLERAGELYLESVLWANTAAESLFGEPGAATAGGDRQTDPAAGGDHQTDPTAPATEPEAPQPQLNTAERHVRTTRWSRVRSVLGRLFGRGPARAPELDVQPRRRRL